ncbi:EthD domain-containing protein [Paraburkholderia sp. HP33-1]|uniref:EthD domain-containing protein n=1 Tax=Paraburkholderia sp. HP33-1 TaxID=2883243 RepID=UPI001F1A4895|nr:EthD domain-containing protein [Paraburkholderia sp. HP33-1]
MFKVIALLTRRTDLSREAFVDYYEKNHAPLILDLMPGIKAYRRNFIQSEGAILSAGQVMPDFDVITEIYFENRQAFERGIQAVMEPAIAASVAADEENVFDRSKTRFLIVEERESTIT